MASQYNFEAIGTHWQIDIYEELSSEKEAALFAAIQERIAIFDAHYSRFRPDSLVTKISLAAGTYAMPEDFKDMYDLYEKMYKITNGLVTPLIGQTLSDAGYDADYSLTQKNDLQAPPAWEDVMEYHHPELIIKQRALLDFGAAGKGYLIDIVAGVIEKHGVRAYCVDAGGDMIHRNNEPITVGLEHPDHADQVIGVAVLQNKSLCGSAGNRRKWQNMHHIINPKELSSPKNIRAVWTVAQNTMLADGLATCLFFVPAAALADFAFQYVIVREDYSVQHSADFPGELFNV